MAEIGKYESQDEFLADDDENEDTQVNKYLFFRIGKESYGIGIKFVIEIIELQNISSVPDMPKYVKGVINLRGRVIPIVDLRLRFDMEEREYDNRTCIIVTEVDHILVGCLVDTVEEVMEIPEKNVEPPPQFRSASGRDRYISGMGKSGDAIKILIDVEKIVKDEKLVPATREAAKATATAGVGA
jgi:purine-binding chemotaxis protein CheW